MVEFINKIQLRGVVGRADNSTIAGKTCTQFSLVTEHAERDRAGNVAVQVTWLNCKAWDNAGAQALNKGDWAEVEGRLRTIKYTRPDDTEVSVPEVICRKVTKIERQ